MNGKHSPVSLVFFVILCLMGASKAFSQLSDSTQLIISNRVTFKVSLLDTTLHLPNQFIIQNSDTVSLDSVQLTREKDYQLDNRTGTVKLSIGLVIRNDTTLLKTNHLIEIKYKALPFSFKEKYLHKELIYEKDTSNSKKVKSSKVVTPFSFDDILRSSNLQKSGSIVRGLTIGTNRDLTVNSGFRMQLSGNLTDDIEVLAALTDENTPIQPEGTTQTLQEVDQVFVELRNKNVTATLGDFNLDMANGEFGGFSRKLEGALVESHYQTAFSDGDVLVSAATARGKYNTQSFIGTDGVQGPYVLLGKEGELDIIVIAGTERVYINGERLTRGETNDYTIEYGTGELTFTAKRLITSASRITVDFEYTDRQYNRSLLAAKAGTSFLKDKYSLNFSIARESDDYTNPVNLQFSDSDKIALQNAGANQLAASQSGIDSVGPGKGNYIKIDTTVFSSSTQTMVPYVFYRFNPLDTLNAQFLVQFSYVGAGKGDYDKISVGHYSFSGVGAGSYLPIRLLPLPEQHSLADVSFSGKPTEAISFSGEFAHSNYDRNRFSTLDDSMNDGNAYKFSVQIHPKQIKIGDANLGSMNLDLSDRYIDRNFNSLDRINEVEFDRTWSSENASGTEEIRDAKLNYKPTDGTTINGEYGTLSRDYFLSKRASAGVIIQPAELPAFDYSFENILSKDDFHLNDGTWFRQNGKVSYNVSENILTSFKLEGENRQIKSQVLDSLIFGSYRYTDFGPSFAIKNIWQLSFTAEYGLRLFDSLKTNQPLPSRKTFTQHYSLQMMEWKSFSSTLDLTTYTQKQTNIPSASDEPDNSLLLRWQSKYNPFERAVESDWYYEVGSERTAKMERIFQLVPIGQGNYVYAGDLNGNHVIDEPDFQPSRFDGNYISVLFPTQNYIPVVNLQTSSRIRLNGSKIFSNKDWIQSMFGALSTETYVRIDERSTDPTKNDIYFLHFSKFLNDASTIAGSQLFSNDFFILENNPNMNLRFRFLQTHGLNQYATETELTYTRERSVRLRWSLGKDLSNQIDYVMKDDNLTANEFSSRTRNVKSGMLSSDISYRPEQDFELGIKFGIGTATNYGADQAALNNQSLRAVYSFQQAGQASIELTRQEAVISNATGIIPFELTSGYVAGKTWILHIQNDYRITKFLQATLAYEGRIEGDRVPVHTGRAEVKAFF